MKNFGLKDLLFIFLIAIIFIAADKYYNNLDLKDWISSIKSKKENVNNYFGIPEDSKITSTKTMESNSKKNSLKKSVRRTLHIHGFGEFNNEDLISIKEGIEKFYKLDCIISETVKSDDFYYAKNTAILLATKVLSLSVNKTDMHMYVTDEPLCNEDVNNLISGHARLHCDGSVVSSKEMTNNNHYSSKNIIGTAKHELAHNFGLQHCVKTNCLMNANGVGKNEFCVDCTSKIKPYKIN